VESLLEGYAALVIGTLSVAAVDTNLLVRVLTPIWQTRTETAGRLRGRIKSILDLDDGQGYWQADNPPRWRGHLEKMVSPGVVYEM
jgi:hypothetical protein